MKNQAKLPMMIVAVGDRRVVGAPRVRVEVVAEAGDDDVEALEPHADQHEDRHHVERRHVRARALPEEDERRHAVAEVHAASRPSAYCSVALKKYEARSKWLAAVPGGEDLAHVEVGQHQARDEDQLGHRVEVLVGDVRVPVEEVAHGQDQDQDHGEAGEDGAVDEEGRRRASSASPGTSAIAKSKDTTLCTESDERGRERGEEAVGPPVVAPLRSEPSQPERQHRVDLLLPAGGGVPQRGDVRHEPDDEEHRADGEVRRDREHVPDQRRLEVRPEVSAGSGTASASTRTTCARRGSAGRGPAVMTAKMVIASAPAVDRRPPLRPEQVQDRGDQRARVPDTDPEHEGRDVHRPHLGRALARRPHADPDLPGPGGDSRRPG